MSRTVRTPLVEFARAGSPATRDGDVVRRRGVIFRSGVYPEKAYSMTPAELRAMAADFAPVPLDAGHPTSASPLDGKLGRLESVELSDDGTTLFGVAAFPRWFDDMLGDARRKVSASWDRATKRLKSLSLVTNPHIDDAELEAAFCACQAQSEAAGVPAAPIPKPKETVMTKREETIAALQAMSDEEYDEVAIDDDDDDRIEEADDDEEDLDDAMPSGPSNFSDEAVALRAEVEELKAERRLERANAFAAELKAQGRIAPYEEATTASVMFSAMTDDAALGSAVHFSLGDKATSGTREAMVRAAYAQRPSHGLTRDAIAVGSAAFGRVLPNGGDKPETDREYAARIVKENARRNGLVAKKD